MSEHLMPQANWSGRKKSQHNHKTAHNKLEKNSVIGHWCNTYYWWCSGSPTIFNNLFLVLIPTLSENFFQICAVHFELFRTQTDRKHNLFGVGSEGQHDNNQVQMLTLSETYILPQHRYSGQTVEITHFFLCGYFKHVIVNKPHPFP